MIMNYSLTMTKTMTIIIIFLHIELRFCVEGGGIIWFFRGALTEPFQKGELDQADIEVKKIFSKAYIDKIIKFQQFPINNFNF